MEPSLFASSPDKSELDLKSSFRKPTNDATSRKYRRHSPVGRSDSSSSGGSPSPLHPREVQTRTPDDQQRKDAGRESERDSGSIRSSRGHDSRKHAERHSDANSHDYRWHDDYSRHHRHVDENNRNYQMSSRAGRESRDYRHSDDTESERISDENRDNRRNVDNHSKEKTDISEHKNKNKEREPDKDYDRDISASRLKESEKSNKKDFHGQEDLVLKRKYIGREVDKHREKYTRVREEFQTETQSFSHRERDGKNEKNVDKASDLINRDSSIEVNAVGDVPSSSSRNLVGFGGVGFLSTDQKKKLLWGNKKNNPTEESSSRWDLHLFQDLERQEKFNRLMGVTGSVAPPENGLTTKMEASKQRKQEELDTDLERQYTAGLRGLGL